MLKRFDLITEVFISIIPDLGQSGDRSHLQKEGNPSIHDSEKEITISMMSSVTKWVSGEKKIVQKKIVAFCIHYNQNQKFQN